MTALKFFEENYDFDFDEFTKFYETLGLPSKATVTLEEIKNAHHRLARTLHPDKCGTPECAERYVAVLRAYDTLKAHHVAFWEKEQIKATELQRRRRRP